MQPVHLLLLFSVFFTYFGWTILRKANRLLRTGRKATATVIDNKYSTDSDGSADYTPVARFTTDKQETIIIHLNYAASKPTRLGKTVDILYDPSNPQEAEVNSVFRLVIIPWGLTAIGVAGLLLASLELMGLTHLVMTEWE